MNGIRLLMVTALLAAIGQAEGKSKSGSGDAPKSKQALNKAFKGRIIKIKKKRVTLYYDFEDVDQLEDFEVARPPRLLDASPNKAFIQGGRLVLEGSSSIRHKLEGTGDLRAKFYVRVGEQKNIGTVFTETVLSDFYVVMNMFDDRFYRNGALLLAACGLHEDEGADDISSGLVNWRDIFSGNAKKIAKVGSPVEVEVSKNGYSEYVRVGELEGSGSSKGKTKTMKTYKFGVWVHHSRATFDDMTISVELTDEFLDFHDLKASMDETWEFIPQTGPLAGIKGVPPSVRTAIEAYAGGGDEAKAVIEAVLHTGLPKKARQVAAEVLGQRGDPKIVPKVVDALYAKDKLSRTLAIAVIKAIAGKDFGYSAGAGESARSKAIRKLNDHLKQYRKRYYG